VSAHCLELGQGHATVGAPGDGGAAPHVPSELLLVGQLEQLGDELALLGQLALADVLRIPGHLELALRSGSGDLAEEVLGLLHRAQRTRGAAGDIGVQRLDGVGIVADSEVAIQVLGKTCAAAKLASKSPTGTH
jgi:hypothetical protein